MISTLIITIVTEGFVALAYCVWRRKPIISILLTVIGANVITQVLLWAVLSIFFRHYLIALLVTEILIWLMESFVLHVVPANHLTLPEATS